MCRFPTLNKSFWLGRNRTQFNLRWNHHGCTVSGEASTPKCTPAEKDLRWNLKATEAKRRFAFETRKAGRSWRRRGVAPHDVNAESPSLPSSSRNWRQTKPRALVRRNAPAPCSWRAVLCSPRCAGRVPFVRCVPGAALPPLQVADISDRHVAEATFAQLPDPHTFRKHLAQRLTPGMDTDVDPILNEKLADDFSARCLTRTDTNRHFQRGSANTASLRTF